MMKLRLDLILVLLLIGCLLFPYVANSAVDDYVVIVHRNSSVSAVKKSELNDIYLKKTTRWKSGGEIEPIDLAPSNPVRGRFSQEVLGKPVAAVQAYWRRLIFSGQGVPPIELHYDGDVLNYVSNHLGAVGYVSATTYTDAADVKKIRVMD